MLLGTTEHGDTDGQVHVFWAHAESPRPACFFTARTSVQLVEQLVLQCHRHRRGGHGGSGRGRERLLVGGVRHCETPRLGCDVRRLSCRRAAAATASRGRGEGAEGAQRVRGGCAEGARRVRGGCVEGAPSVHRACAERAPSVRRACAKRAPSVCKARRERLLRCCCRLVRAQGLVLVDGGGGGWRWGTEGLPRGR